MCIGEMAEANPPRGKMRFRRNAVRALPAVLESLFPSSSAGMLQQAAIAQTAEPGF